MLVTVRDGPGVRELLLVNRHRAALAPLPPGPVVLLGAGAHDQAGEHAAADGQRAHLEGDGVAVAIRALLSLSRTLFAHSWLVYEFIGVAWSCSQRWGGTSFESCGSRRATLDVERR